MVTMLSTTPLTPQVARFPRLFFLPLRPLRLVRLRPTRWVPLPGSWDCSRVKMPGKLMPLASISPQATHAPKDGERLAGWTRAHPAHPTKRTGRFRCLDRSGLEGGGICFWGVEDLQDKETNVPVQQLIPQLRYGNSFLDPQHCSKYLGRSFHVLSCLLRRLQQTFGPRSP